ncbi:DUF881 domain-containing protein [Tepidibacter thalassicus]|uniref:DUF881 domain-containing protein n=1 Tax=Tepidibacter thalassicus DSM 15285 TaxID=1123350 RepID=A0A1M5T6Y8_9FIRM|nr:DUF881 domain-containing protein [Tepidibacter thalassicus]SHH46448.1 protein of unknown function [Tepidibacter thalassicus DSM 15285]
MKNKYWIMVVFTLFLGISIGIQTKGDYNQVRELSFYGRQLVEEINKTKQENRELLLKKEYLNLQIDILERNKLKDEVVKNLKESVDKLKMILGYKDVQGPGIIIKIDTNEDINLGELMESRSFLVQLANQIKTYGGEVISINNQRITSYSEITLAGEHININNVPIVQPYEIKVIGDKKMLSDKYINDENFLIDTMKKYNLSVDITTSDNMIIKKSEREKNLKYIKVKSGD